MRLLIDWIQIHPGIPRVAVHAAQALEAGNDSDLGRPYLPDPTIDMEALDARLTASPAASVDEFLAHVCALVTTETGFHADAQAPRPAPPAPVEDGTVTA